MPEYIVDIEEILQYRMRVTAESIEDAEAAVWEPLEEVSAREVAGEAHDAHIDHVRARELYDWEKEEAT
jgi:hypothetical protein